MTEINELKNNRIKTFKNLTDRLEALDKKYLLLTNRFSNIRLSVFITGILASAFSFFFVNDLIMVIAMFFFTIIFSIIVHFHNRLDAFRKDLRKWIGIKNSHIARMNLDWENIPFNAGLKTETGDEIESDLNLTGYQSIGHLIDFTSSRQARSLLKEWLSCRNPSREKIMQRQKLVKELSPMQNFRDKLYLISLKFSAREFDGEVVEEWFKTGELKKSFRLIMITLGILAPVNIALFVLYLYYLLPGLWMFTLLIYIIVYHYGDSDKNKLAAETDLVNDELIKLSAAAELLGKFRFAGIPELKKICQSYTIKGAQPSYLLKNINFYNEFLKMRHGNPFVWGIFRIFMPIDYIIKYRLAQRKKLIQSNLSEWLSAWYTIEALNSLANFAYLNPGYKFPEIIDFDTWGKESVAAVQIGHPLIPEERKVRNDFIVEKNVEIDIITGSNMSGKSTFLRTLGVNAFLTYAGAPVDAHDFKIIPARVFTCIKVSDSVVDGISYFYAEVKRLKALLDEADKECGLPLFFLIDEIFRGTNNIERLTGSRAFIKELSRKKLLGAIATHDLELVKLAEEIPEVKNYHFKEEIMDGRMKFDYKIHTGPCPTTNALKIMRMEGLPVDDF